MSSSVAVATKHEYVKKTKQFKKTLRELPIVMAAASSATVPKPKLEHTPLPPPKPKQPEPRKPRPVDPQVFIRDQTNRYFKWWWEWQRYKSTAIEKHNTLKCMCCFGNSDKHTECIENMSDHFPNLPRNHDKIMRIKYWKRDRERLHGQLLAEQDVYRKFDVRQRHPYDADNWEADGGYSGSSFFSNDEE